MQLFKFKMLWVIISPVILLLLIAVTLFYMSPTIGKWYLQGIFSELDLVLNLENIDISYEHRTATLLDVVIRDKQQKEQARFTNLVLKLDTEDMLEGRLVFKTIEAKHAYVHLDNSHPEKLVIAGIPVANNTKSENKPYKLVFENIRADKLRFCYTLDNDTTPLFRNGCTEASNANWQGQFEITLDQAADLPAFRITKAVNADFKTLIVSDLAYKQQLIVANKLIINGIKSDESYQYLFNFITADHVKLVATTDNDWLANINHLEAKNIHLNKLDSVALDSVAVSDLQAQIHRLAKGQFAMKEFTDRYSIFNNSESTYPVKINRLSINGKSILHFIDSAVQPAFDKTFSQLQLTINQLDTTSKQPFSFNTEFQSSKHGHVSLDGTMSQPGQTLHVKANGKLEEIDLTQYAGYVKKMAGHDVSSGHLNSDFKLEVIDRHISATFKNKLHNFYLVEKPEKEGADEDSEDAGMTLPTALSMLRNKDGSVDLELPIKGDINNPDFSVLDAINQVANKAVTSYLIAYYNPFGLIGLAGINTIELISTLRFTPIKYKPGGAVLSQPAREELDLIRSMLHERPHVHLVICGKATRADYIDMHPQLAEIYADTDTEEDEDEIESSSTVPPAIILGADDKKALSDLALRRTHLVKEYIASGNPQIARRLVECKPQPDIKDKDEPRTEIHI